ncbi:hypothetical protein ASE74_04215 [Pedobacter sp. Leaf216]|nr:hypothetical protein ASE74_04215 [Pedobacter sp. Leaf216]
MHLLFIESSNGRINARATPEGGKKNGHNAMRLPTISPGLTRIAYFVPELPASAPTDRAPWACQCAFTFLTSSQGFAKFPAAARIMFRSRMSKTFGTLPAAKCLPARTVQRFDICNSFFDNTHNNTQRFFFETALEFNKAGY